MFACLNLINDLVFLILVGLVFHSLIDEGKDLGICKEHCLTKISIHVIYIR